MGIALVTGASAGLGTRFAELFAADGHSVILVARRKAELETIAERLRGAHAGIQAHVLEADLGKPGAGQALFDRVRGLGLDVDFLVNNAGFGSNGAFSGLPLPRELQMIDLNVRALVELTHLFLPGMLSRKSGRILQVGSTAGFQPGAYMATYYASKAFVNSFGEALHEELRGTGVSCTVLAPGPTATEFGAVAGNDKSVLFRRGVIASAASVAAAGYRGMMRGRALVIPGVSNKFLLQAQRISPRAATRRVAGMLNAAKS